MRRISLRAWFCGAIITVVCLHANAAGLGQLDVKSVLGEPLRAEVAVLSKPGEAGSLAVRLASPEAYQAAGLVHTGIVSQISVTLAKGTGEEPVIRITSAGAINEPVIDLLLELTWASGRITREYTVFIDPPFIVAEREKRELEAAVAAAEAEEAARGAETQAASVPDSPIPTPLPEESVENVETGAPELVEAESSEFAEEDSTEFADDEEMEDASAASSAEIDLGPVVTIGGTGPTLFSETPTVSSRSVGATQDDYSGNTSIKVKRGDTLSQIAIANKPAGVTLEQMLAVLYRKNPQAFSGNNMNRLRTGKIIQLGDPEEYAVVTKAEARKEVSVQSADWNKYKESLAAATMMQPAGSEQSAQQSAGGAVTPKLEDQALTPLQKSPEVVKLSKGEPAQTDKGGSTAGPGETALREQLVASEKAVNEANARVARLEKIIEGLQKLEVENQKMAERQAQAEKAKPVDAEMAVPTEKPNEAAKSALPTEPKPVPAEPAQKSSPTEVASLPTAPKEPGAPSEQPAPADGQAANVVQAPGTMPPVPTGEMSKAPDQAAQKPRRRPPPPPPPPAPSLLDQVLEKPYLAGVPLVLVLLLGWGVAKMRGRKRETSQQPDEDAPAFAATTVTSTARGTFSPAETDVGLASNRASSGSDEVDPLEEAEIFLAYGRDAQAEELLKEAIVVHPVRFEIHVKLLEIYAKQNNIEDFEKLARDVQQGTGGQGELWNRVVRLGYSIDPGNPRYADGAAGTAERPSGSQNLPHESSGTAERLDFDVGFDDPDHSNTGTDIDLNATAEFERTMVMPSQGADTQSMDTQALESPMLGDGGQSAFTETDLNVGLPVLEPEVDSPAEFSAGQDSNSVDFDFDVDNFSGQDKPTENLDGEGAPDLDSGLDFDIGDITQNMGGEDGELSASDMPALDLSGISLDLDGETTTTLEIPGKDEKWYEVQTKFDLAKAYQEMGDKDGAREILKEVVSEGDAEQQSAAESVLATLD